MSPLAQRALDDSSACRELFAELARLLGQDPVLDPPVGNCLWGVWDPDSAPGEILGAGDSPDEALADALATVRGWAK